MNEIIETPSEEIPDVDVVVNGSTLVRISAADKRISELNKLYGGLKINGIDDKMGYKTSRKALSELVGERVALVKYAKDMKKPLVAYLKQVNSKLKPAVKGYQDLEAPIRKNIKVIDKLKQDKRDAFLQTRIDELAKYGVKITISEAGKLTVKTYKAAVAQAKKDYDKRIAEEAAAKARKEQEEKLQQQPAAVAEPITMPDPTSPVSIPVPTEDKPTVAPTLERNEAITDLTASQAMHGPVQEAELDDRGKIELVRTRIANIDFPECDSDKAQRAMFTVKDKIKQLLAFIDDKIQSL